MLTMIVARWRQLNTRDVPKPSIIGDVKFGDGNNVFTAKAGDVTGDISFGGGTDALILSNEIADDDDDYTAPATDLVTGRITNGSGQLSMLSIGDRSVLHLEGKKVMRITKPRGWKFADAELCRRSGNLKFTIDASQLSDEVIPITAGQCGLTDDARLTPALKSTSPMKKPNRLILSAMAIR